MIKEINKFLMNREMCRLVAFQRNELLNSAEKKTRKIFGRFLYTKILSYFVNKKRIEKEYFDIMNYEYKTIKKYIPDNCKNILSIGGGLGGLESIINKDFTNISFNLVEKNYVSKKIVYGWDRKNNEAYNNLNLTKKFMLDNGVQLEKIKLYDYDNDELPNTKFDIILSLYSLEYHYQLELYLDYFKKINEDYTIFIFDTVNPNRMKEIFKEVKIIHEPQTSDHNSKRVLCRGFLK